MKPLNVAFVWHMHQPYYKDDLTSTYLLPWVRLRSAKDYYKMPALLDGYPGVRATFNLVPSLLAQIEDYGRDESVDLFLNLSSRDAAELSPEEREFILRWMREAPRALRVQQSPRYLELASRPLDAQFTTQEMRDLQVWFNLAWCDPVWVDADPKLSERHFSHREDAERQIELGHGLFERLIGHRPSGMWPSEMAVGESVAELAVRAGVEWMISDEEVLARSIDIHMSRDGDGRVNYPAQLYRPHKMDREGKSISIVFRDSLLSNLVSFDYQRMPSADAARDLVNRLERIREQQDNQDFLAVV